jgi:hypothetical protein
MQAEYPGAVRRGGWGYFNRDRIEPVYISYGLWSVDEGLVSRPLSTKMENDPLARQCESLIENINSNISQLPFKLEDSDELWLFDQDRKTPVVLLDSKLPSASSTFTRTPFLDLLCGCRRGTESTPFCSRERA